VTRLRVFSSFFIAITKYPSTASQYDSEALTEKAACKSDHMARQGGRGIQGSGLLFITTHSNGTN
jgi:hypothetical protein